MSAKHESVEAFNNGNMLYKGQLYTEALDAYKNAVKIDNTFYDAHFCVAKTQLRLEEIDQGLSYFEKYKNLIPQDKRSNYVLALAKILNKQEKSEKALSLIEDQTIVYNDNQQSQIISILLANNKTKEALHQLLNFKDRGRASQVYTDILQNESIPKAVRDDLEDQSIIPQFFNASKRVGILKRANTTNKDFHNLISTIVAQLTSVKKNKDIDHKDALNEVYSNIEVAQKILESQAQLLVKLEKTSEAKKLIVTLESTKYSSETLNNLKKQCKNLESDKNKKTVKLAGIAIGALFILGVAGYFGYSAYDKSQARKRAMSNASISSYTYYLNKYGNDEEIHKLREKRLYEKAIETNDAKDFAELSRNYGSSKYLRTIEVKYNKNTKVNRRAYGLGNTSQRADEFGGNSLTFQAPKGAKVGYTLNSANSIPINRTLTVVEDLKITERIVPKKELKFNEEFSSNKNGWNTFDNPKKVYGRTKQKGVRVSNGELKLYNEINENQFTYSSINTSHISKNGNYEIETSITRTDDDRGTFLLFGMGNRAFNYFAINKSGQYQYGYNNWNSSTDNWVALSNGWRSNNAINRNNYATNTLKVVKQGGNFSFYINGAYIGNMAQKRWYGNRIGFGINDRTGAKINNLNIYKKKNRVSTNFVRGKTYFCWVDELNVRSGGSKGDKVITTITLAEPVKFLGGKGKKPLNATFKGIFSPDYYYEVELTDGTIGWVHGGALQEIPTDNPIGFDSYKSVLQSSIAVPISSTDKTEFYMIAIYAEKTENSIQNRVNEIKANGYNANYLWIPDYRSLSGAKMYSAYVGPYSTKEACKSALLNVRTKYPKAYGLLASKNTNQRIEVK